MGGTGFANNVTKIIPGASTYKIGQYYYLYENAYQSKISGKCTALGSAATSEFSLGLDTLNMNSSTNINNGSTYNRTLDIQTGSSTVTFPKIKLLNTWKNNTTYVGSTIDINTAWQNDIPGIILASSVSNYSTVGSLSSTLDVTSRDILKNSGWGGTNCSTSLNTRLSNAHIVLLSSSNPLKPTAVNTWATRDVPELKKYARAYVNVIIGDALNTYLPVFKYSGASTYSANAFGTSTYYAVMKYVVDFVNGKVGVYCNNIAGWNVANHIMVSSIIASENDKL